MPKDNPTVALKNEIFSPVKALAATVVFAALLHALPAHAKRQAPVLPEAVPSSFELLPDKDVAAACGAILTVAGSARVTGDINQPTGEVLAILDVLTYGQVLLGDAERLGLTAAELNRWLNIYQTRASSGDEFDFCMFSGSARFAGLPPGQRVAFTKQVFKDFEKYRAAAAARKQGK